MRDTPEAMNAIHIEHICPRQWITRLKDLFDGVWSGVRSVVLSCVPAGSQRKPLRPSNSALTADMETYHTLVEQAVEGMAIVQGSRVVFVNSAIVAITGYTREELFALTPEQSLALVHPDDRDVLNAAYQLSRSDSALPHPLSLRIRRKDGIERWLEICCSSILYHNCPAIQILCHDSTACRERELLLEEQLAFLRQIIDSTPNLIFVRDQLGRFTLVNQALAAAYGTTVEELTGKTDADANLDQDGVGAIWENDQEVLTTRQEYVIPEKLITDASGKQRWLRVIERPLLNAAGEAHQVLGVAVDITETHLLQSALQQINAPLWRSLHALEEHYQDMVRLNDLSRALQSCCTNQDIFQVVAHFGACLFPDQQGMLLLFDPDISQLHTVATWGGPAPLPACCLDRCRALQGCALALDALPDERTACPYTSGAVAPPLCVPLQFQGRIHGVIRLLYLPGVHFQVRRYHSQLMEAFASHLALAMTNLCLREELREQSIRDPLTNLFNRRYLEESLQREFRRAQRLQQPVGIIMMDIDHFKRFNDTYGHEAGDAVLQMLGTFLQTRVREEDIACRYGGEEFTLILPGASLEVTWMRAEALRVGLKALPPVDYQEQVLDHMTVSLGVASFPEHGTDEASVLRAADQALYQAKAAGRDRVCIAEAAPTMLPEQHRETR